MLVKIVVLTVLVIASLVFEIISPIIAVVVAIICGYRWGQRVYAAGAPTLENQQNHQKVAYGAC